MSNQKTKRAQLLNRKVRGIENVAWAILGTVLAFIIGLVLWLILSGSVAAIDAPQIQLVPHESFIFGNTANVTLKFGRGFSNVRVSLLASDGTTMTTIATCTPSGIRVAEGGKISFHCDNLRSTPGIIYVRVVWDGGSQTIKWVVG
jgi:hypothetical protein